MQPSLARQVFVSFAALAMPAVASAQTVIPTDNPSIRRSLDGIKAWNAWTLEQQVAICEIPAPSFKEQVRGAEFRKRLIALGYPNARIDAAGNVVAERAGSGNGPTVMIAGHLDTVFPEGTNVRVKREGDKFTAPGIGREPEKPNQKRRPGRNRRSNCTSTGIPSGLQNGTDELEQGDRGDFQQEIASGIRGLLAPPLGTCRRLPPAIP